MTTAALSRHDLPRRRYGTAKAAKAGRCWGLDGHVRQLETRRAADAMATPDDGAPGLDGVPVEAIAAAGVAPCLAQRRDALVARTDRPWRHRRVELPPAGGTVRVRGMPARRDRVVQGGLNHLLEPIVAAAWHAGASGDRPTRTAQPAVDRVAEASGRNTTRVLDGARAADVDRGRHAWLLVTVARRVNDRDGWPVWKRRRNAAGQRGGPQGGVVSPRRSHLSRTAGEAMRERAQAVTAHGTHPDVEDARAADALGSLVHPERRPDGLVEAINRRRRDDLAAREGPRHAAQSRSVDRRRGERVGVWGVDCRRRRARRGRGRPP